MTVMTAHKSIIYNEDNRRKNIYLYFYIISDITKKKFPFRTKSFCQMLIDSRSVRPRRKKNEAT